MSEGGSERASERVSGGDCMLAGATVLDCSQSDRVRGCLKRLF